MSVNIFEVAARNKMRLPYKGLISVEDLWDLSVQSLDSIFKVLNSQVKQAKEESLLNSKSKEDETLEIQIEIVKHIVSAKLAEKTAREKAFESKEKRQKIMDIMAAKDNEELLSSSKEDLQKMLAELGE